MSSRSRDALHALLLALASPPPAPVIHRRQWPAELEPERPVSGNSYAKRSAHPWQRGGNKSKA